MTSKPAEKKRNKRTYRTGSISKRGKAWLVRFSDVNGKRRVKSLPTLDLAGRFLKRAVGEVAVGRAGMPPDPRGIATLSELFEPWIEARQHTHVSWRDDRSKWNHVGPFFGGMRPAEVTPDEIGKFVDALVATGLSSTTVGHQVRLLSTFLADVAEDPANGLAINPVRTVRKATRKKYRTAKFEAPFIEKQETIRGVFLALPEPYNVMFACGVMLGLRTAEVIGLAWEHVDLRARRVRVTQQVRDGRIASLKDEDPRSVPIQDDLIPVLTAWRLQTGGSGLLFRPKHPTRGGRPDLGRRATFVRPNTMNSQLRKAFAKFPGIKPIGWRHATRTTFGSHHVMNGGSLEELRLLLGHEDQKTTQTYAKLRVDLFPAAAYSRVRVDFSRADASVTPMASDGSDRAATPEIGIKLGSGASTLRVKNSAKT